MDHVLDSLFEVHLSKQVDSFVAGQQKLINKVLDLWLSDFSLPDLMHSYSFLCETAESSESIPFILSSFSWSYLSNCIPRERYSLETATSSFNSLYSIRYYYQPHYTQIFNIKFINNHMIQVNLF